MSRIYLKLPPRRGRPPDPNPKIRITVRLVPAHVEAFRRLGGGSIVTGIRKIADQLTAEANRE